jgi:hypothetical protein
MAIVSKGINTNDRRNIEEILRSTEYFYDFEIETALEIADETLTRGTETSGYYWMKISDEDGVVAFANYGKNDFLDTFLGTVLDSCASKFKKQKTWLSPA